MIFFFQAEDGIRAWSVTGVQTCALLIGWNGVQHTLMAELAGPRAATTAVGLGLAVSSLGVTLGPPVFGACVEWAGGYRGPWLGLALTMAVGLLVLALVREHPRLG